MPSCVALIPARSGSKRIPDKNIRPLNGVPLLAYTIAAARESGVFMAVLVSTDSDEYQQVAHQYGALTTFRPKEMAQDDSPDYLWVCHAIEYPEKCDAFAILRPTSPFRTADTIRRAWKEFLDEPNSYDSLRAVEPVRQHPNKMWVRNGGGIIPYNGTTVHIGGVPHPGHSVPTQLLPQVLVQNASLEIAWTKTLNTKTISGTRIRPFITEGYEGFDINTEDDWLFAEMLIERGLVKPEFTQEEKSRRKVRA